jgi:hypothetical protein
MARGPRVAHLTDLCADAAASPRPARSTAARGARPTVRTTLGHRRCAPTFLTKVPRPAPSPVRKVRRRRSRCRSDPPILLTRPGQRRRPRPAGWRRPAPHRAVLGHPLLTCVFLTEPAGPATPVRGKVADSRTWVRRRPAGGGKLSAGGTHSTWPPESGHRPAHGSRDLSDRGPGASPAAPRKPAARNPRPVNFSGGPGCPIGPRSQKSCPQSPTSGRPGPLSPCATPGDEPAHIWGWICGQLGQSVDRTEQPRSCPPGARVVHRSHRVLTHTPRHHLNSANRGCPHNPQPLLLLLVISLKR